MNDLIAADEFLQTMRKPKMYLIRWRNPEDGSWSINVEDTFTKSQAKKAMQINRVLFGATGQLWPYEEWMTKHHRGDVLEAAKEGQ